MSDLIDELVDESVHHNKKPKKEYQRKDPVLRDANNPDLVIITETPPVLKDDIDKLYRFLAKRKIPESRVKVISALDHNPTLTYQISRYYRDNHIDFTTHIPRGTPVVTLGRAIYAVTHSDDLDVESFYDYVFNSGWFFDPRLGSRIYPVDDLNSWLGLDTFKRYFASKQIRRAYSGNGEELDLDMREPVLKRMSDPNRFLTRFKRKSGTIAWDLETIGLDPWAESGDIICLTLTFDGVTGYYLPWKDIDVDLLSQFFRSKRSIGSNLKYDVKWLVTRGVDRDALWITGDTQHLGHLLNEMRRNGLKPLSWIYTSMGGYDEDLDRYVETYPKAKENYSLIPRDILFEYATKDPIATYRIHERQLKQLEWIDENYPVTDVPWLSYSTWSLSRLYHEIIVPTLNTFADIELEGMKIDIERVRETSQELAVKLQDKKREILKSFTDNYQLSPDMNHKLSLILETMEDSSHADADTPDWLDAGEQKIEEKGFNLDSGEQLGRFLEELGWERVERAKKGHYKTNDAILHKWSSLGRKEADLLLEYRAMSTLMKTFVGDEQAGTGMFQYIKKDGKVHSSFLVAMADSLRSKSRNPNVQNIPKRSNIYITETEDMAHRIRSFFIPPDDDYVIGESDGASLQLSLEAQLTEDENMMYVFKELGGDMHSMSAQQIYMPHLSLEEFRSLKNTDKVVKIARYDAKAVNFSLIFNTTASSFAAQSLEPNWDLDKAKAFVEEKDLEELRLDLLPKAKKMHKGNPKYATEFSYYWAAADYIKTRFMESYPGVKSHIERSIAFAEKNGYIRSPYGSIRRVPELTKIGNYDRPSHIKNLQNVITNSPIQTMEAVRIYYTMNKTNEEIKKRGLQSRLSGMVHDSILSFKHRKEIKLVSRIEKQAFEEMWPENRTVPLTLEVEISDPKKDEYWGFGKEIDVVTKTRTKREKSA